MEWDTLLEKLRSKSTQDISLEPSTSNNCEKCGGYGYTVERRNGELFSRDCECEIKRRVQHRIERSGLGPLLPSCRFDTYQTETPWQSAAKEVAQRYLAAWRGKWLYMGGAVGSGKTHLCVALCGELMKAGVDLMFLQWRSDATNIKSLINDAEAYRKLVEPLRTVKALYIDDFLKGGASEADLRLAFDILNTRYNNPETATIISSEWTTKQLVEWDEGLGSRIVNRSKDFAVNIGGTGKNWRLQS